MRLSFSVITFKDFSRRFKNENQKFLTSNILTIFRKNDAFKINDARVVSHVFPSARQNRLHPRLCNMRRIYGEDMCRNALSLRHRLLYRKTWSILKTSKSKFPLPSKEIENASCSAIAVHWFSIGRVSSNPFDFFDPRSKTR